MSQILDPATGRVATILDLSCDMPATSVFVAVRYGLGTQTFEVEAQVEGLKQFAHVGYLEFRAFCMGGMTRDSFLQIIRLPGVREIRPARGCQIEPLNPECRVFVKRTALADTLIDLHFIGRTQAERLAYLAKINKRISGILFE